MELLKFFKRKRKEWEDISFDKLKEGDTVRVAVGFSPYKKVGIVSHKLYDYMWIKTVRDDGSYIDSFTASKSYCNFQVKNKEC